MGEARSQSDEIKRPLESSFGRAKSGLQIRFNLLRAVGVELASTGSPKSFEGPDETCFIAVPREMTYQLSSRDNLVTVVLGSLLFE